MGISINGISGMKKWDIFLIHLKFSLSHLPGGRDQSGPCRVPMAISVTASRPHCASTVEDLERRAINDKMPRQILAKACGAVFSQLGRDKKYGGFHEKWGYPKNEMDGLCHGKCQSKMDDDWGYHYFRKHLYEKTSEEGYEYREFLYLCFSKMLVDTYTDIEFT